MVSAQRLCRNHVQVEQLQTHWKTAALPEEVWWGRACHGLVELEQAKAGPGAPMPAPKMLKACVLFCAAGESCDACHPDDDGYDVLATQVFNWIVANRSAR